jgi:RNA recognition motif-containing protein
MVLFIGNINKLTTNKDLTDLLSAAAKIRRVAILLDGITGRSRGCAYAEIEDGDEAQSVIRTFSNTDFMGANITISAATSYQQKTLPWK